MGTTPQLLTVRSSAGGPPLTYWAFVPEVPSPSAALVLVHGSQRHSRQMFRAFLPDAMASDIPVIVPRFPASVFPGFQRLAGVAGPMAARVALNETLVDAREVLGVETERFAMCGYSGGAQFAHRFALFEPMRLARLIVVSAGYYTYLDPRLRYPYGIGSSALTGNETPDPDAFLRVPVHVLVGEQDVDGGKSLRGGSALDSTQGRNRLARARRWVDHLEEAARRRNVASRVSFDLLPATSHSFSSAVHRGGLVSRVAQLLESPPPQSTTDSVRKGRNW